MSSLPKSEAYGASHDAGEQPVLAREIAEEQAVVDRAYGYLRTAAYSARLIDTEAQRRYLTDRADWHREEASTALFERDAFAFQSARRLAILSAEHEGLVFGRLDLADTEVRHIGRLGVRDDDFEPLVIDWRAPAAEPFYRATYTDPMGVKRRRVLHCRGEQVVGIEDDLLDAQQADALPVLGEGALLAALSRARSGTMRDIVATIQAEQDEAIRAPYPGVTIISGGPGTGKTVVALHRAAYLLYTHRRRLTNGGVLIVGPSMTFMRYIERVLPGLGEDSVTLKALGQIADDVLMTETSRYDEPAAAALKGSLRMVLLLRRLVADPLAEAAEAQRLTVSVKGEILTLHSSALAAIRRRILAAQKANQSRETASLAVVEALWTSASSDLKQHIDREMFADLITGQARWQMFMQAWWPMLDAEQVLARLGEHRVIARVAEGILDHSEQACLAASWRHASGYAPGLGLPRPQWTIADMALLDELTTLIGPVSPVEPEASDLFADSGVEELVTTSDLIDERQVIDPDTEAEPQLTYAHILVDESQDVTPMQWRMLRRRGPQASWTIVGDPAQSSFPDPSQVEKAVADLVGVGPGRTYHLATNYRSPQEVFDLAGRYIVRFDPDADLPVAVRTTGVEPDLRVVASARWPHELRDVVRECIPDEGTTGVIVPDRLMPAAAPLNWPESVSLVTPLEAKGMEYDVVVVVAPDEIAATVGPRVLYVALTRPTQRLVTVDFDSPGEWRESLL